MARSLLRSTRVIQKIAAGCRRVTELQLSRSAFEIEKPLFWIMPADPLVADRCRQRIDAPATEIDDERPACPARPVGAAQVKDSLRGRPAVTGRSQQQDTPRNHGNHPAPAATVRGTFRGPRCRWWKSERIEHHRKSASSTAGTVCKLGMDFAS